MRATRISAASVGIIHREEDPELRRHREEVLETSRAWRIVVVVGAVVIGAALVWSVLDTWIG